MELNEAYCHVVARVLAADGKMEETERNFLYDIMDKLSLTVAQRDAVIHFEGAQDALNVIEKLSPSEREKLRDDMLGATLIDGDIAQFETDVVAEVTAILGL